MEKETELYEIGYILRADLKEEAVLAFGGKLRNAIVDKGGLVTSEGRSKKQELAYPIKKETFAIFNWIKFMLEPDSISEVKDHLEKESSILRFIIVKTEAEKAKKIKPIRRPKKEIKKPEIVKEEPEKKKEEKAPETQIQEEEIDKKIEELLGEN